MVAAVETMMYAKEGGKPWHGLGTAVDGAPTSKEAIIAAGIDWDVEKRPVYYQLATGEFATIDDRFANVRIFDEKVLGVVAGDYQVLQNAEGFEILDRAIGDLGLEVRYETAGSLREGKEVFITARLPKDIQVGKGDAQFPYLMLRTGHDGGTALDCVPTFIRPVCWNTVTMALGARNERGAEYAGLTMWHVGSVEEKVAQAKAALNLSLRKMDDYAVTLNQLAEIKATKKMSEDFYSAVLPEIHIAPEDAFLKQALLKSPDSGRWIQFVSAEQFERAKKGREERMEILLGVRSEEDASLYGLFNAATGYADHARPRMWKDPRNKMNTIMFGNGAVIKRRAWNAVTEIAKIEAPTI